MKELQFHGAKIITGRGSVAYLKKLGLKRAFIVIGGNSIIDNGTLAKTQTLLEESGCEVFVFAGVPANPPVETVIDGIAKMRQFQPDAVIGLGGGSPIDAAKAMSVLYEHPDLDPATAFRQGLPETRKAIKLIAIPSTSGTATEVTLVAVLTYKQDNLKVSAKTPAFVPDYAILDSDITLSMPQKVVAETGMDAVGHAVESYITKNNNDFTECLAAGAVEGLFKYLPLSYAIGDPVAREKVHNLQCMAGCAFTNTGLGVNHGICHAIGGRYGVSHGLVVGIGLPYVLEFNSEDSEVSEKIDYLGKRIGKDDFVAAVRELQQKLNIPGCLKEAGIPEEDFYSHFDELVGNALKGPTGNNPVPVSLDGMRGLLRRVYEGR
ncbi:MAG: iron-containing alcohol dehydrogenase [Negativicutes bacterium]|nr:iron-containing alcohol dehydrogenase [Negativicutes bacterium]